MIEKLTFGQRVGGVNHVDGYPGEEGSRKKAAASVNLRGRKAGLVR